MSDEVERLRQELDTTTESTRQSLEQPNLEALRDRVLSSLKLGKQSPGYKTTKKALEKFIEELSS
ncbi:MAG: hypothetical protein LDL41_05740 [Coleofasciculus sp. S288]|nr:hypothetical protein [Coleofasciculus sp. S288]